MPGSRVSYAAGGRSGPRSYRVDFAKLNRLLPGYRPTWDACTGALQLAEAYRQVHLSQEEFTGPRYTRLVQLKALIDAGRLDGTLRWV